jgi:hypothetical protein
MNRTWTIIALLVAALGTGCAAKKGFEKPGFSFGCPIGDAKVSSMEDLVKLKVVQEGKRTTILATEMRCTMTGDLYKVDVNLNNDSSAQARQLQVPLDRPRGDAGLGGGSLEAAAYVREQQHYGQRRGTDQQSRGLPPYPAEPGVASTAAASTGATMALAHRKPLCEMESIQ